MTLLILANTDGSSSSDCAWSTTSGKLVVGTWANVLGAIDFIRAYDGDQPLFIYLPLGYPHPPYCVEEPWFSLIEREKLPERAQAPENWEGKAGILQGIIGRVRDGTAANANAGLTDFARSTKSRTASE